MSLVLEAIGLAIPIGFQLVLDDVVVSDDRDLLTLIALTVGLLIVFRGLVDFVRSWVIMAASSRLAVQWKMSLFRYLLLLPLSFFAPYRRYSFALSVNRQDPTDAQLHLDLPRRRDSLRPGGHDVVLRSVACTVGPC